MSAEETFIRASVAAGLLKAIRDALWRGADPIAIAALVDTALERLEREALDG